MLWYNVVQPAVFNFVPLKRQLGGLGLLTHFSQPSSDSNQPVNINTWLAGLPPEKNHLPRQKTGVLYTTSIEDYTLKA